MSEQTDATEDRRDDEHEDVDPGDDEDGADEEPQPWAKASSGEQD
ncbi:MAG TPA: hypothetical protein VIA10_00340 [Gaiellaceae bacterium]|jgi:hypothetical protein